MKNSSRSARVPEKTSGWRGSRAFWLEAAKRAFIDHGIEAVKVQKLANEMKIARTSFYWFFKDRDALLIALLEEWEEKNTGAFIEACASYAETISEALLNLIVVFHDEALFEPQLDFAIRGWAHQSQDVASQVHNADEIRLNAIKSMFDRFGFESDDADVRARALYLTQIGYISLQVDESRVDRMRRVARYTKTFCGHAPSESELARFYARLDYIPQDID